MITSFQNVKSNFYKIFAGESLSEPLTLVDRKGESFIVPIRPERKSERDYTEETVEAYPIISIQDTLPTPMMDRNNYKELRISRFRDTDNDGKDDSATVYPEPQWYDVTFTVSAAAKSMSHLDAINDWFAKTFDHSLDAYFVFNPIPVEGYSDPLGDLVKYTLDYNDSPRTDGVYETSYTFNLRFNAHFKDPYDVEVGGTVSPNFNNQSI